jgi:putative glutamine amidotransferase
MARARVGVSSNFMHADPDRPLFRGKTLQYVEARMVRSVWRSAAVPIPLPEVGDDDALRLAIDEVDGVLLTGGADVAPRSYGETPIKPEWGGDAHRDAYEQRLVEMAMRAHKPILGICRGIQLLNVALGGTLYQDIATQIEGALPHRDWHRYDDNGHGVRLEAGARVTRLYGDAREIAVNSIHHQAIKALAPDLRPTAWAPDGVIEAVEHTDPRIFIVGVQWHPEWLESERVTAPGAAQGWADGGILFDAFTSACLRQRG